MKMQWPIRLQAVVLLCLISIIAWLNSGTLVPYGVTIPFKDVALLPPCNYLVNPDHSHFVSALDMIKGAPIDGWRHTVMLRRWLYPALLQFFEPWMGMLWGGLVLNLLLIGAAGLLLLQELRRLNVSSAGSVSILAAVWLFPGWQYFIGLPYCYGSIGPLAIFSWVILSRFLDGRLKPVIFGALLGSINGFYDFLPTLLPAAIFASWTLAPRNWKLMRSVILSMIVSTAAVWLIPTVFWGAPRQSDNSRIYNTIFTSFWHPEAWLSWLGILKKAPGILVSNAIDASYGLAVPILLLGVIAATRIHRTNTSTKVERHLIRVSTVFLLGVATFWCVLNLAPEYPGRWQIRGRWIARIYMPGSVPLIILGYCMLSRFKANFLKWVLSGTFIGFEILVGLSGILGIESLREFHYRVYQHSEPHQSEPNALLFGRRPLGFCHSPEENL